MPELCTKTVNRGGERWDSYEPCGRPVKKDGLCGVHFAARERKLARVAAYSEPDELAAVAERLAVLRKQRDQLIRDHDGTLREIGAAAGLSPQAVLNIKNRKP